MYGRRPGIGEPCDRCGAPLTTDPHSCSGGFGGSSYESYGGLGTSSRTSGTSNTRLAQILRLEGFHEAASIVESGSSDAIARLMRHLTNASSSTRERIFRRLAYENW